MSCADRPREYPAADATMSFSIWKIATSIWKVGSSWIEWLAIRSLLAERNDQCLVPAILERPPDFWSGQNALVLVARNGASGSEVGRSLSA